MRRSGAVLAILLGCPILALAANTRYENFTAGSVEGGLFTTFGGDRHGQTFTVGSNHTVGSVRLKMYREVLMGNPGTVTVAVKETEKRTFNFGGPDFELAVPIGPDLATGTIAGSSIVTGSGIYGAGAWYTINLSPVLNLTEAKEYAIAIRTSGDPIHWKAAKTYLCGNAAAGNYLDVWNQADPEYDFPFEAWGDPDVVTGDVPTATGTGTANIAPGAGVLVAGSVERGNAP